MRGLKPAGDGNRAVENARRMVGVDPGAVLRGRTPRLIDEWQTEPDIWNYVRRAVDDRAAPGQFILTGSAVPPEYHLALRMRPFSLFVPKYRPVGSGTC